MTFGGLFLISLPLFFLIDLLWLGVVARDFYRQQLGDRMAVSWPPALLFYGVFLVGLTYFATAPALALGWPAAGVAGALYGFFTYATYDLTNLATLKDWPVSLVVVDMVWGTVLGGAVAASTVAVYSSLFASVS